MKRTVISIFAAASMAFACGKSESKRVPDALVENGGTGSNPAPETGPSTSPTSEPAKPNNPGTNVTQPEEPVKLTCSQKWDQYIGFNTVGEFTKYATKSTSNFGGQKLEIDSNSITTVKEVAADRIVLTFENSTNGSTFVSDQTILKTSFISNCENIAQGPSAESGEETVTVPAGTFQTIWNTSRTELNKAITVSKAWMGKLASGDVILVKSESNTTMPEGTMASKQELIETNKN